MQFSAREMEMKLVPPVHPLSDYQCVSKDKEQRMDSMRDFCEAKVTISAQEKMEIGRGSIEEAVQKVL